MGVPILRLPVVALKVLLDYMNNVELATVSISSKRADWILKACGKKNVSFFNLEGSEIRYLRKFTILTLFLLESKRQGALPEWNIELCCSVGSDLHISISCKNFIVPIHFEALENIGRFEGVRSNLKIGESSVPVVTTREYDGVETMRTFWNTKTHGMIVLMDYFKNDFNLPIEELKFAGNSNDIRTVINHINSTQTIVRNVLVERYSRLLDEDFEFILNNVSAQEEFFSHWESTQNFKFKGKIRAKRIVIWNGRWFTLQALLRSTENEEISVDGRNFNRDPLRRFLRKWKSGRFPILKEVDLATRVSYKDATKGLLKRWDKCEDTFGRQVVAFRGHGDSYGTVYPDESGQGFFRMLFHNDGLLQ
ncbi:unnamed protein product [Caenorhabditis brenneri]